MEKLWVAARLVFPFALAMVLAAAFGCAGGPGPGATAPPCVPGGAARPPGCVGGQTGAVTTAAGSAETLGSGPVSSFQAARFSLSFPLPDAAGWREAPSAGSFLELEHRGSGTRLLVRLWTEAEPTNRAGCEASARAVRPLPAREAGSEIGREALSAPSGFDTEVHVGVARAERGGPVAGYLLAFGASGRSCFAYVLTTEAQGAGATQAVAERLALMQTVSLRSVVVEHASDPLPRARP